MHVDDGKSPVWKRGDSTRGVALWDQGDAHVLVVHIDGREMPLALSNEDVAALHDVLERRLGAKAAAAAASPLTGKAGPPCDRCKSATLETRDGYSCTHCDNVIMWV